MVSHILIVDSDTIAAEVTRAIVSRAVPEATVAIAPVAADGALNMHGNFPDVLIIDPSPHDVDGARLIRQLKVARTDARVIVIASAPTPMLRRRVAELEVDAYLEKPVLLSLFMDQLRALRDQVAEALATYADQRLTPPEQITTAVGVGPPAQAITEEAPQRHVDLIVMATHGYIGLQRWRLGSVADQVLHATTTPLLLVRS